MQVVCSFSDMESIMIAQTGVSVLLQQLLPARSLDGSGGRITCIGHGDLSRSLPTSMWIEALAVLSTLVGCLWRALRSSTTMSSFMVHLRLDAE